MKVIFGESLGQEKWDEFIKNNSSDFGLLQSAGWAKFQRSLGRQVFQLAAADEQQNILAVALIIKQKLPLGKSYFYIPRGPVVVVIASEAKQSQVIMDNTGSPPVSHAFGKAFGDARPSLGGRSLSLPRDDILSSLFSEIENLAKKEKAIFLRLDPAWENSEASLNYFKKQKLKFSGQVQPKQTLILDLTKSEEELLAQMKPKTRYNIKVAQKHCLKIDEGEHYFENFWQLMKKTAKRDNFSTHSREYYYKMVENLASDKVVRLVVAKDGDRVIAANLMVAFGYWCVYLHGASDYGSREKMAPYLLQWEAILSAKAKNKKYYDFWGVDEDSWPGVTRFKTGFALKQGFTQYVGSWDLVYNKRWYGLYRALKKIKS